MIALKILNVVLAEGIITLYNFPPSVKKILCNFVKLDLPHLDNLTLVYNKHLLVKLYNFLICSP